MADGFGIVMSAIADGLEPDPELRVDEWSESHMILPRKNAAEHGPYRNARTPYARRVMECLSPVHPCRRVAVRAASQMLKTQSGLNWVAGSIDLAPANMLVLMPTLSLAKRLSARIGETIRTVPRIRDKVASPRSRDARNTVDTKEFDGGTLHITTAGSAANLAEIAIRYGWGDEVDRWDLDVDGEGDPVKLLENRTSTYSRICKLYYTSSPGVAEFSRIDKLVAQGTEEHYHVPCPHCGTLHRLEFANLQADAATHDAIKRAWMVCPHCAGVIEETCKGTLLLEEGHGGHAQWVATRPGDGETISFAINALYAPLGWVSWLKLAKERAAAEAAEAVGDTELMQVFRNTREAISWSVGRNDTTVEDLVLRGEAYAEWLMPAGSLVLTVGVDVQHDRIAVSFWAWGRGLEGWLVYWGELPGDTRVPGRGAWVDLERLLFEEAGGTLVNRAVRHEWGGAVRWRRCSLDTGDGATQESAYMFCRKHRARGVLPIKGGSERGAARLEIYAPPKTSTDVDTKEKPWKRGLKPYIVGTSKAKDTLVRDRLPLCDRDGNGRPVTGRGEGRLHWYAGVRGDFHEQLLAEVQVPSRTRRGAKEWLKKAGHANEALDTLIYAFHAAYAVKLNLWRESQWQAVEHALKQPSLLALPVVANESLGGDGADEAVAAPEAPTPATVESAAPPPVPPVKPAPVAPARPSAPRRGFSVTRW